MDALGKEYGLALQKQIEHQFLAIKMGAKK